MLFCKNTTFYHLINVIILSLSFLSQITSASAAELLAAGPSFIHKETLGRHSLGAIPKIHYSNQGYIWLGSKNGLVRFDGNDSKVFRHQKDNENSLSNNDIWGISEDSQGNLWVSTNGGGIDKFNLLTESFENLTKAHGLPSDIAFSIYAAKNGHIWVGTAKGLSLIDPVKKHTINFDGQSDIKSAVWSIFEDKKQQLWVGTSDGLYIISSKKEIQHFSHQSNNPLSLSNNVIRTIHQDRVGNVWLGTDHGLNLYLKDGKGFKRFLYDSTDLNSISGNEIYSVFDDHLGQFWVGTFNKGLNRFDPQSGRFDRLNINTMPLGYYPESSAYSIIEDSSGMLWMGSENGIVNLRLSGMSFNHLAFNNTTGESIVSFTKSDRSIHAISDSELFKIDSNQPKSIASFKDYSPLTSITNDSENTWLGSFRHGLIQYDSASQQIQQYTTSKSNLKSLPSNVVSALLSDSEDTI